MKQNKKRKVPPAGATSPIALLERERRQLERYLFKSGTSAFKLSRAQFTQTGVMNDWSVKEILAWLVSWERGLLAWLRAPGRRLTSTGGKDDDDLLDPETFRRLRRRPLDDVVEEFRESFKGVMRALRDHTGVVSDIVALNLISRYSRARSHIRKWLKTQSVEPISTTSRSHSTRPHAGALMASGPAESNALSEQRESKGTRRSRSKKHQPRRKAR